MSPVEAATCGSVGITGAVAQPVARRARATRGRKLTLLYVAVEGGATVRRRTATRRRAALLQADERQKVERPSVARVHAVSVYAAALVVAHNHPSGNPEPSKEDVAVTKQLVEAGRLMGIPVHDHLILAGSGYASLAERGLM